MTVTITQKKPGVSILKTFKQLVDEALARGVGEIFPWDLEELLEKGQNLLLLDIREIDEYNAGHIKDSLHVPRGLLESACDYGYAETVPELAAARDKKIVVICRSGNRSVLAAEIMSDMGYKDVLSLKTGIRGWNDNESPLYDSDDKEVDIDEMEVILSPPVTPEQIAPKDS